ncbi:hypothetical protein HJC23_007340 [Cyclotella cryptica]|uniref:MutL C-terminal dimerisation domain-containing protein n=1 Tax=Cyclotella cryptica TaxID=29204 RepID=A0ABD3PCG2_9STRA|eukprot:CCRYP_015741-RA/>CCRYP_015741-RA protein AED:0.54 eAED:0.52 QI:0/-1/0/1/-1/1/1/0/403
MNHINSKLSRSHCDSFPVHSTRIVTGEAVYAKCTPAWPSKDDEASQPIKPTASPFSETFFDEPIVTKASGSIVATKTQDVEFEDAFLDSPARIASREHFDQLDIDNDEETSMPMQWTRKRIRSNDTSISALMTEGRSSGGNYDRISLTKDMLATAEVIAQVEDKFIIIKTQGMLCVVDQHAADERVALEKLENALFNPDFHDAMRIEMTKKHLLVGDILKATSVMPAKRVSLTASQLKAVLQHRALLNKWHFTFKQPCIGAETILITGVPTICGRMTDVNDFLEFVDELKHSTGEQIKPECVKRILASQACRYAIMFGDKLSDTSAKRLISDLSECDFAFICAHGRPSVVALCNIPQGKLDDAERSPTTTRAVQKANGMLTHGSLTGPKRVIRRRVAFHRSVD